MMILALKAMTPKEDCERLLDEMLRFAKEMLAKHAEFHPFGGMIRSDGSLVHLSAMVDGVGHPGAAELIGLLHERLGMEVEANHIIAAAVVLNVGNIRDPQTGLIADAIRICLDHIDNYSVEVLLPYHIVSGSAPLYGRLFAQRGENNIFT